MTRGSRPERLFDREAQRAQANREELVERLTRLVPEEGMIEPIEGLLLSRASAPTEPVHGVSHTCFCVIAQGSKEVTVGEEAYRYDPAHYLLATADLPMIARVTEASRECPYLSLNLHLDAVLVGSVLIEAEQPFPRGTPRVRAVNVSPLDAGLLDATVRFVRLLDTPAEAQVLAPLVTREIVFRLLRGEQGERLHRMMALGGSADRIARAVEQIRTHFDRPLRMDHLARELGMSTSSLHHQFKEVTALTPLQFQKQLRLQEARQLMLGEDIDAASAGYRVGYEDPSHFNREYKRLFGLPPMRDVARLREVFRTGAGE